MYYTYILRCSDGSLYTGITTDVMRRFGEHKAKDGKGAKYTRSRSVVSIAAVWLSENRRTASRLEAYIKRQPKPKKEKFIINPYLLCELQGDKYTPCNFKQTQSGETEVTMQTIYKNALIDGVLTDIITEDGKFSYIGKTDYDGIDLGGAKVYPGLIDIHTHGCTGFDTMDGDLREMSKFQAKHGVTAWLPTTMTASFEALSAISDIDISSVEGAEVLGFHFEGPYICEEYKGAQNPDYIRNPDIEEFKKFKNVKMVTVAPELEGGIDFIKNCGCIASIGHTSADYETAIEAISAGASCLTHTFNAMPPIHHRNPSVIGAAAEKGIYAQVICDGLHIHPAAVLMLYKLFGSDKMILISDSMRATGLSDGTYDLGGLDVIVHGREARLKDGTLAGSATPLLDCVKCAVSFGIPEADAIKMASETPAALLGVNKGKIAVGYDADFIAVDDNLNLLQTVIKGRIA